MQQNTSGCFFLNAAYFIVSSKQAKTFIRDKQPEADWPAGKTGKFPSRPLPICVNLGATLIRPYAGIKARSISNQVSVNISDIIIPLSNHVKILAWSPHHSVWSSEHTKATSKSCFYHIRALKHNIRDSLDSSTIRTIAASLVTSRLDYANSVLYGIPTKYISRLQRTHNIYPRTCCCR